MLFVCSNWKKKKNENDFNAKRSIDRGNQPVLKDKKNIRAEAKLQSVSIVNFEAHLKNIKLKQNGKIERKTKVSISN